VKQSWKPASQNIQLCTYKRAKGRGSLEQINTNKKGICSLNKDIKTNKQQNLQTGAKKPLIKPQLPTMQSTANQSGS
jgi:hypothetical protein